MTDSDLFTRAAAARHVGVSTQAVTDRADAGKLPFEMVHGAKLYHRRDLEAWKAERQVRAQKVLTA